LINLTDI